MIDNEMVLSENQAVTASAASTHSHAANAARNLGKGNPIYINSRVTEAFTDDGSNSTVTLTVEVADESNFSDAEVVATLKDFDALSPVGTVRSQALAIAQTAKKRIRAYYTVTGGNLTTGKFFTWLSPEPEGAFEAREQGAPAIG